MNSETLVTHPDFRSLDPTVKDAETMDDYLGEALFYQHMFDKRTTPWEVQQWDYEALQKFEVNLEKVDRLYYIHYERKDGKDFQMIARMEYEDRSFYVELNAGCDYTGFECQGRGVIFISTDANMFMKLVLTEQEDFNKDAIYESLREDSIYVEEEDDTRFDKFSRMKWKNTPMLKYLCHEVIYQNRDTLREYSSLLPNILTESVDDFIRTRKARIAYDDYL